MPSSWIRSPIGPGWLVGLQRQLTGIGRPSWQILPKNWDWEEFGEAMEKDYGLASKRFWEYGVWGPLLRAVKSLYNLSRSLVRIAGSKSDLFSVHVDSCRAALSKQRAILCLTFDCHRFCSWFLWTEFQGLEGPVWGPHNFISAFCGWCCPH